MKTFILSSMLFLTTLVVFSQTYTLEGIVTKNQSPCSGVHISVKNSKKETITDSYGHYKFQLPQGKYELVLSDNTQKKIRVTVSKDQRLNISISALKSDLAEVFISAFRVDADSPITYSNLSHQEIEERDLGQDIPILMNYMPSVVTTSDAGAGVGYTGIRVRGSDASRVNVTINGVPLNDAESQGAFWVDLGSFSSAIQDLQLQRGVGTSTNGAGAFGASLNVLTDSFQKEPAVEITNTYGSFETHKHQATFNTGLINDHWAFTGNFSLLKSDGYRDRAFSDLKSYFLQGVYQNKNTLIKALGFGGSEQTYQAYYGISPEKLKSDRTFNPAGQYTDENGQLQFFDNQTDNYKQDHFQLLWNQKYNAHWSSNLTLHYTYGRGYYESYREDADLKDYGLPYLEYQNDTVKTTDLVTDKWLSNHFYGTVFNVKYKNNTIKALLGGGWNQYQGDHYGDLRYTKFAKNNAPFKHYYDNRAIKQAFNIYSKVTYALTDRLSAYGDLQLRTVDYKTHGHLDYGQDFFVSDNFLFFNPKAGLTFQINPDQQLYLSYSRANREPNRDDYKSSVINGEKHYPKAEKLNDYELGWRYKSSDFKFNANLYYMDYKDQLVLTGDINDVGSFIRKNSGESYRLGLEIDANIHLSDRIEIRPNFTWSRNINKDYSTSVNGEIKHFGNTQTSFSPSFIAGNMLRYRLFDHLQLNFLTKFVGKQYLSNIEASQSQLDSYLVNSFNLQYTWEKAPLFKEVVFTGLINNIFNKKYVSNGFYSPDAGPSYYPQAGINFLTGITLKF